MSEPKDIPDFLSQLGGAVFTTAVNNAVREGSNSTDVSPGLLSQLAPGVLAQLAGGNAIPYNPGLAASHAASVATGKLPPALGGAWIWERLIKASVDDPAAQVHALHLPEAVAATVISYEELVEIFKNRGMLIGLITLPFEVEWPAHQWLRALHLPTPSKRIADYISGSY